MAPSGGRARNVLVFLVTFLVFFVGLRFSNVIKNNREVFISNLREGLPLETLITSSKLSFSAIMGVRNARIDSASAGRHDGHQKPRQEGKALQPDAPAGARKHRHVRSRTRRTLHPCLQILLLLALGGDVHANPGPISEREISFFYCNAQSILGRDKLAEFNDYFADGQSYDCISVTESWLKSCVSESEILSSSYNVYRQDRNDGRVGGGVLLALSSRLQSRLVDTPVIPGCDHVWAEVPMSRGAKLIVGTAYIPPVPSATTLELLGDCVASMRRRLNGKGTLLLMGDFNTPGIDWLPQTDDASTLPVPRNNGELTNAMIDMCAEHDLAQHVFFPSKGTNFLDLLFTCGVHPKEVLVHPAPDTVRSDHTPFEGSIVLENVPLRSTQPKRNMINWRRVDIATFREHLASCTWHLMNACASVDECCSLFYDLLDAVVRDSVPTIKVNTSMFPRWFSSDSISAYQDKRRAHCKWKRTSLQCDYVEFATKRTVFKNKVKSDYVQYIQNTELLLNLDPKEFFKFVCTKSMNNRLPNCFSFDGNLITDKQEICDAFSHSFKQNFSSVDPNDPPSLFL